MNVLPAKEIICIQYGVISAACAFSLVYFAIVTNRSAEHSSELFFYKLSIGFAATCAFTDVLFALREFAMLPLGSVTNYASEILYSLASICGTYCWFIYSEKKQQSRLVSTAGRVRCFAVPFVVMSVFTLTTPLHRLCFSLDGSQYIRGVLNVPFTVICGVFVVYPGVSALIRSFRKKHYARAVLLRLLFVYAIFLGIAQMMQVLVGPILPFRSLTAAVIFMFITLRGMCETVTIDALSNINNRFSFNRVVDGKISGGEEFWLVMLDIDRFKSINDIYGHIEGDKAIRCTAAAITRAVPHDYFVARYGGDEFAVVAPLVDEAEIAPLEDTILRELKKVMRENNCPFDISITAGYAKRDESILNTPDMIEAADHVLYERKRRKKVRV